MKKILLFAALIWAMCANAQITKLDTPAEGMLHPTEAEGIFGYSAGNSMSLISQAPDSVVYPLYSVDAEGAKPYKDIVVYPKTAGRYIFFEYITRDIFTKDDGKLAIMVEEYDQNTGDTDYYIYDEDGKTLFTSTKIDNGGTYENFLFQIGETWYLAIIYRYYNEGAEHTYANSHFRTEVYALPGHGKLVETNNEMLK